MEQGPEPIVETRVLQDDRFATSLRDFGPIGILAILVIILTGNVVLDNMVVLPIGATLVLVWVRLSRTPWCEIGYVRPRSWVGTIRNDLRRHRQKLHADVFAHGFRSDGPCHHLL